MPLRMKADRQLDLDYGEHDAAPAMAEMSDEIFHSEFSGDNGNGTKPWTGSFADLQKLLKLKIDDINEQTGRLETLREAKWQCDGERLEHQQKVKREEMEAERLQASITATEKTGKANGDLAKLRQELSQSEQRKKEAQTKFDEAVAKCGQAKEALDSEMAKRRAKYQELDQLASQHQQLVRKIKTDPQQRRYKQQLEKTNKDWDVITWPRPPRPALIVANAIAREIDQEKNGRRVYLIRNAERVQDIFPNWINECFIGEKLDYVVGDANQPRAIPERRNHPGDYLHDPPVTEMGRELAILTGLSLALHDRGRQFYFVSSPSLYCLQTAMAIKEGADLENNKIVVEPGLFEDFNLEVNNGTTLAPNFLNAADFKSLGGEFNSVSSNYHQSTTLRAIKTLVAQNETLGNRSNRQISAVAHALTQAPANASVVIVAHPATLQAVDSFLGPRMPLPDTPKAKDLLGLQYPYLSVVGFHEMNGRWKRIVKPLPPFSRCPLTNAINVLNNDGQQ